MISASKDGEVASKRDDASLVSTRSTSGQSTSGKEVAQIVADFQAGREREKNFRLLYDRFYRPVRGFFAKRVSTRDCLEAEGHFWSHRLLRDQTAAASGGS